MIRAAAEPDGPVAGRDPGVVTGPVTLGQLQARAGQVVRTDRSAVSAQLTWPPTIPGRRVLRTGWRHGTGKLAGAGGGDHGLLSGPRPVPAGNTAR